MRKFKIVPLVVLAVLVLVAVAWALDITPTLNLDGTFTAALQKADGAPATDPVPTGANSACDVTFAVIIDWENYNSSTDMVPVVYSASSQYTFSVARTFDFKNGGSTIASVTIPADSTSGFASVNSPAVAAFCLGTAEEPASGCGIVADNDLDYIANPGDYEDIDDSTAEVYADSPMGSDWFIKIKIPIGRFHHHHHHHKH